MTSTTFFDTHDAVKQLISAGFTERQAETEVQLQVKTFVSLKSEQTTIKQDLHEFKTEVEHEFTLVRHEINEKFNYLDMKFTGKFNLIYWMLGAVLAILSPALMAEVTHVYSLIFHQFS